MYSSEQGNRKGRSPSFLLPSHSDLYFPLCTWGQRHSQQWTLEFSIRSSPGLSKLTEVGFQTIPKSLHLSEVFLGIAPGHTFHQCFVFTGNSLWHSPCVLQLRLSVNVISTDEGLWPLPSADTEPKRTGTALF